MFLKGRPAPVGVRFHTRKLESLPGRAFQADCPAVLNRGITRPIPRGKGRQPLGRAPDAYQGLPRQLGELEVAHIAIPFVPLSPQSEQPGTISRDDGGGNRISAPVHGLGSVQPIPHPTKVPAC